MRIAFDEMQAVIRAALIAAGMGEDKAGTCARIHTESSRDGVYSHGLNRVPGIVKNLHDGWINPLAEPTLVRALGCMENRDGNLGPGITNALDSMDRAMALAEVHGIGLVALRNTTHWLRGGTYAWQAADRGFLSICWTNAEPCMPAWGSKYANTGNNPLCIGIPGKSGHLVLDMAMSLYSYGKLETTKLAGKELPYPGGYDADNNLSSDPAAIMRSQRLLPAGLWKGSGLAVALDLAGAILSDGINTAEIAKKGMGNSGCSQVFIAVNPELFCTRDRIEELLAETRDSLHSAEPAVAGELVTTPGERTLETREENTRLGIPADPAKWARVRELAGL